MVVASVPVDGSFVPRARPVASVVVDGEAVLHHAGALHHLNPTATVVWQCCDGEVTVDALAVELAEAFAVDVDTARGDVLTVVADLAAAGLLRPPGHEPPASAPPWTVLVDPEEACASCAERPWAENLTVAVGTTAVPVGVSDPETGAALGRALASHVVLDAGPFTPYYALVVPRGAPAAGRRALYTLHRGEDVLVQTRRPARVLRALLTHLAAHGDPGPGLAAVPALVVGTGGRALLVPPPARPVAFARALARHGVAVADMPAALVDAGRGEVVVGAPGLDVDFGPLDACAAGLPPLGPEPDPLAWGRYPLAGVALAGGGAGRALLALAPRADRAPDSALAALTTVLDRLPVLDAGEPAAIAAALDASGRR
jgi:hypothetical protein